jgi:hypothetical protein
LGIITTLMTFSDRLPLGYRFCVPPKATPDEAIRAALAFLEGNRRRDELEAFGHRQRDWQAGWRVSVTRARFSAEIRAA